MVRQNATFDSSFCINAHRSGLLRYALTRYSLRYPPEVAAELKESFPSGQHFWRLVGARMKKRTVSVRLDPEEARRIEKAASLAGQSQGAFLQKAGEEVAHRTLLNWAVARYQRGEGSFSQLAEETGLAMEEIMAAMGGQGPEAALDMFLASCKTVAELQQNPEFLRMAREAVEEITSAQAA